MIDYQFRPISTWPGEMRGAWTRKRATFKAGYNSTILLLSRELSHLRASKVVIEAALDERDIRNDGLIRSGSRPKHPGIILSFSTPRGPMRFPCDTYNDWQQNLRAIALALEALRRVDRYGVTKRGEQYTGWRQLPSGIVTAMSVEQAAELMCRLAGNPCIPRDLIGVPANVQLVYREAAKRTHPDLNPNGEADFKLLQEAKRVLDAHHGV